MCGKGTKIVLVPLPPAVGRAMDRATGSRTRGPVLLNTRGARMDRRAPTHRLHQLAEAPGIQVVRAHPHMPRHTPSLTTSFDAGVDLRDVQIAARHADPRTMRQSGPAAAWTGTRPRSSPPTSQAPPGKGMSAGKLRPVAAAAGRSYPRPRIPITHGGDALRPQREREPP